MMEFLLDLLKEERQKRKVAEREAESLRMILEPLQQQEMDRIRTKSFAFHNKHFGDRRIVCDAGSETLYDETEDKSQID